MIPVAISHSGHRYMLTGSTMYASDGTPMQQPAEAAHWAIVGYVRCLFAWQRGEINLSTVVRSLREKLAAL